MDNIFIVIILTVLLILYVYNIVFTGQGQDTNIKRGSEDASTEFNNIGTPSINVPVVDRSNLPSKAGVVEHMTNTDDYDSNKIAEYKRFNNLVFG